MITLNYWRNKFFNTNKGSVKCELSYKCKYCSYCEYCQSCSNLVESKDSINCHNGNEVDLSVNCNNCNNIYICEDCENVKDSYKCNGCKDCDHCYCCDNLDGKSYMAYNVQLTKERYEFAMDNRMGELLSDDFGIEFFNLMYEDKVLL